jgi:tetratricopeptide (TPR) repeat protein
VAAIDDAGFAAAVHRVLRDGTRSQAREGVLIGVFRRQLAHAAARFAADQPERATDTVFGAFHLVRVGEGRAEMIDEAGAEALAKAIEQIGPRGDEGQARVLMTLRAATLPAGSPARRELDAHVEALDRWIRDTRTGGPMEQLGAEQRAAVSKALLDPDPKALEAAADAVDAWIAKAIEYNLRLRSTGEQPERSEAMEAARALETGGLVMASLFLRSGDARMALDRLERSSARRVLSPALFDRIRDAAENDGARDWQDLVAAFIRQSRDADFTADPALVNAAVWGTALESYRRDPAHFDSAMLVGRELVAFGMSEAAPLVLADALTGAPPATALSAAMTLVLQALNTDAAAEDPAAARRTFAAAGTILAAAERKDVARDVSPSAARARSFMASIELRAGDLEAARGLLVASLDREPSVSGYLLLATVERQAGHLEAALSAIERAIAPSGHFTVIEAGEANLLAFEIHHQMGAKDKADRSLKAALDLALAARGKADDGRTRTRAERLLARALDAYGDAKGATRALDRALEAAAQERPLLGATVLEAVGRALVQHDVDAGRAAVKHGIEGSIPNDDLVYAGLWLTLLEREAGVPSEGTAARAIEAGSNRGWVGKLAAWANGKVSASELHAAARNASQRVEAAFYTSLAGKIAGDPEAEAHLRSVAQSPIIDVLEVQLARELTVPRLHAELPKNIRLP